VISAGVGDDANASAREQVQAAYGSGTVLTGRPRDEIAAYFGDLDLVPPGLVPVTEWPLDAPDGASTPLPMLRPLPSAPMKAGMLAGIGRKRG
jgi:S-adenosyl methyltransferase